MLTATERAAKPPEPTYENPETAKWRGRLVTWKLQGTWTKLYGLRPDDPRFLAETECPKALLVEFGLMGVPA